MPSDYRPDVAVPAGRNLDLLRAIRSRWAYVSLLTIVAALGVAAEARGPAGPDIGYFLYSARKVIDGGRLYRDVVEINPPLIVALNAPAVLMARLTGWSDIACYRVFVAALLLASLVLSAGVLCRVVARDDELLRRWVVGLVCFALFLVGAPDYGQREHLMLALIFPYLLLVAARAKAAPVSVLPAAGIGIVAGLGFSLKPQFLLVWLTVETGRLVLQRGRRPWVSVESVAIGCILLAYGGITLLLTPEYFPLVRLLAPEYSRFLAVPFSELLLSSRRAPLMLVAGVVCIALANRARYRELWITLLLATLAAFVAAAAQQKGWHYHFYPAIALAYVLLGVVALDMRGRATDGVRRLYASIALAVVATGAVWFVGAALGRATGRDPQQQSQKALLNQLTGAVRGRDTDGGLFAFSYATGSAFPLVNYTGLEWASRFPQLWLLVATYRERLAGDGPLRYHERHEMRAAERFLNEAVYQDLAAHRPALLLVLRHARDVKGNGPRRIDYLGYFARDARIAALLRRYRPVENVGEYRLYERIHDDEPSLDQPPEPPPGTLDLPPRRPRGWQGALANRDLLIQLLLCAGFVLLAFLTDARRRPNGGHNLASG